MTHKNTQGSVRYDLFYQKMMTPLQVNISDEENQNSALPAAPVWIIALGGWDYDKSHPDNL